MNGKQLTIGLATILTAGCVLVVAALIPSVRETPATEKPVVYPTAWHSVDAARTQAYIEALDLDAMQRLGCDFDSPRFDPTRFGYTMDELRDKMGRAETRDYDFARLTEVEKRLDGVDRRAVLEHIFDTVTEGAETNTERHLALLKFMHRVTYHSTYIRPRFPDEKRSKCFDPLILLELNEMHCGQVARLAIDLWEAGGFRARGLNFGAKASAEVYYDDAWHYFDGDSVGGNGMAVRKADGTVPSWYEMSQTPEQIDLLPYRYELSLGQAPRRISSRYRSVNCFYDSKGDDRLYWDKIRPAEPGEPNYGWQLDKNRYPADWIMHDDAPRYQPGAARFTDVVVHPPDAAGRRRVEIAWDASKDGDGDLLGYRVYVSRTPRGWTYSRFRGDGAAKRYWNGAADAWEPAMYDALHTIPPSNLGLERVTEPRVTLDLDATTPAYVTVMPFDAYGEQIGKQFYLMSNELRIP